MTNLTEQYHNSTLPDGFYYFNNGKETYIVHYDNIGVRGIESVSVVDKVPSYEENTKLKEELKEICEKYLKIKTTVSAYEDACKDLHAYIKKLKELLKRINEHFKWVDFDDNNYVDYELWDDIKKVLGED